MATTRVELTLEEKLAKAEEAHALFQGATTATEVQAIFQGFVGDLGYKVLGRMFSGGYDPAGALNFEKRQIRLAASAE